MSEDRPPTGDDLRGRVLHGGRLLLIRQGAGLVISLGGVLALTRMIGPSSYGVYASAFAIAFFAQATGELSLDVYLVRYPGDLPRERCDQVFTLLVILAVITTALTVALAPAISHGVQLPGLEPVLVVMFLSLPAVHLQQVHLSRLEREFDYASIGIVELVAQTAFFVVALPLAARSAGVWAPVAGWWVQQLVLLGGFWHRDSYRPRLLFRVGWVRDILSYGAVTTSSNFVYSLRGLVAPVFVGHELGAAAVGYVSLAVRLGQQLGFAQQVMFRVSIAALGRIANDRDRLRRAMTQGAELQLLCVGIPLAVFSLIAASVIPVIFGMKWLPVAGLIPLLAPPYMAMAFCSLLTAAMTLQRRPWDLIVSQGASAALLWIGAIIFIPMDGVKGYGYAELLAMASWLITDQLLVRRLARPHYGMVLLWWGALSAAALAPLVSWWLLAAVPACLAIPSSAREFARVALAVLRPYRGAAELAP